MVEESEDGVDPKLIELVEYPVRKILDKRIVYEGLPDERVEYKVDWGDEWPYSWEPEKNLNCPEKIREYELEKEAERLGVKKGTKFFRFLKPGAVPDLPEEIKFWKDTDEHGLIKPVTTGSLYETVKRRSGTNVTYSLSMLRDKPIKRKRVESDSTTTNTTISTSVCSTTDGNSETEASENEGDAEDKTHRSRPPSSRKKRRVMFGRKRRSRNRKSINKDANSEECKKQEDSGDEEENNEDDKEKNEEYKKMLRRSSEGKNCAVESLKKRRMGENEDTEASSVDLIRDETLNAVKKISDEKPIEIEADKCKTPCSTISRRKSLCSPNNRLENMKHCSTPTSPIHKTVVTIKEFIKNRQVAKVQPTMKDRARLAIPKEVADDLKKIAQRIKQIHQTVDNNNEYESTQKMTQIRSSSSQLEKIGGDKFPPRNAISKTAAYSMESLQNLVQRLNVEIDLSQSPKVYPISHLLIPEEAHILNCSLITAVAENDVDEVRRLFTQYRPVDFDLNALDAHGQTLLMKTSSMMCDYLDQQCASCKILLLLIVNGAAVDFYTSDGTTALMVAVKQGNCCKVKKLLAFGARLDAANVYNENSLFLAVRFCSDELVDEMLSFLLQSGIDLTRNNENQCAVDVARALKRFRLVHLIDNFVQRISFEFQQHLAASNPCAWTLHSKILEFRYLEVKPGIDWRFSFEINELSLPKGFAAYLFLSTVQFVDNQHRFESNGYVPIRMASLNDRPLDAIYSNGNLNILWLRPLFVGLNTLVISMNEAPKNVKLVFQSNIVQLEG